MIYITLNNDISVEELFNLRFNFQQQDDINVGLLWNCFANGRCTFTLARVRNFYYDNNALTQVFNVQHLLLVMLIKTKSILGVVRAYLFHWKLPTGKLFNTKSELFLSNVTFATSNQNHDFTIWNNDTYLIS